MPQMAPYNWLLINLLFSFTMLIFITIIHFSSSNKISSTNYFKMTDKFNTKW